MKHPALSTALLVLALPAAAADNYLLAPGDVDGDGDVDLIRITANGIVHLTDVDGVDRHSFDVTPDPPSWWAEVREFDPDLPERLPVWVSAVAEVPDTNTNGSSEVALAWMEPYSEWGDARTATPEINVWDPMTQSRLAEGWVSLNWGIGVMESVGDQTGDGVSDIAMLEGRGFSQVGINNGVTGLPEIFLRFSWRFAPVQILSNGYGVGILGNGRPRWSGGLRTERRAGIEFVNTETGEATYRLWLGVGYTVHQAALLPSVNGGRSTDWAVLRTTGEGENQRTSVVIHDSWTKSRIRTLNYIGWADPLEMMVVNGTELAVVSRFEESGAQPLEVRDARTGSLTRRVWFPATLSIESVTRTPDINGNGSDEIAVVGEQWGNVVVIIRDSRTGQWLRRIVWDS